MLQVTPPRHPSFARPRHPSLTPMLPTPQIFDAPRLSLLVGGRVEIDVRTLLASVEWSPANLAHHGFAEGAAAGVPVL